MPREADWTFMVYMAGDNDLSSAGDVDLAEMRRVGSTDRLHVAVELDNAGPAGSRRIHVERDGAGERVELIAETDSGDPAVLRDFVAWAAGEYPARRYALVLWNHGGGWAPAEIEGIALSAGAPEFGDREAIERSAGPLGRLFFRRSLERILARPSARERAICSDDGSGHSLDTLELAKVLADCVAILGRPIDLLGLDACLMGNLEVAYEVRERARFLVASEQTAPETGWPYDRILARLAADPGLGAEALAGAIVGDYVDAHLEAWDPGDLTQSGLDLSRIADAAAALDRLAASLTAHLPGAAQEIWTAQRRSTRFAHDTLWDAAHFCGQLAEVGTAPEVRSAASAARQALEAGAGKSVLAERHHGAGVSGCGGLSIYLVPPGVKEISPFYCELAFARDFRWLGLLEAYHGR